MSVALSRALESNAILRPRTESTDGVQFIGIITVSESAFPIAPRADGQCEGDIGSWYGRLQRRVTREIVRICSRLRSGTEYDIFTSVDLIDRRHSLDGSIHLRLPQDSARCRIHGSNLAVARARENHTTRSEHGANF